MSSSLPIYVGDVNVEEIPGSKIIQKRGEAMQIIRTLSGQSGDLFPYLATLQVGVTQDDEFHAAILDGIEATESGPMLEIKNTFYGPPNGYALSLPNQPFDILSDVTWEPRSVMLGTTTSSDGNFFVNYYSPTFTYKYTSAFQYSSPQMQSAIPSLNPNSSGTAGAGGVLAPVTITIFDFAFGPQNPNTSTVNFAPSGTWVYKLYPIVTGFRRAQKGSMYNYDETWAILIANPNGVLPVALTSGTPQYPDVQP